MTKKTTKTAFLGGGFLIQQYPWLLPIIDQYCKKKKINKIIFENKPTKIFYNNKYFKNIFSKYKILSLEEELPIYFRKKIVRYLYVFPKAFIYALTLRREKLLKEKSWKKMQFTHAVWDTATNITKDFESFTKPNFKNKLFASIKNFETKMVAKILIKNQLSAVFLNHSVYFYRTLLSEFREDKNIQTFIQANYAIYKQNKYPDNNESVLKNNYLKILKKEIPIKSLKKYWQERINGKSIYQLANDASKNNGISNINKIPKNILMLHIFKDSPFSLLDKKRIFSDYTDWLNFTLKVIANSNENWGIKFHPSASRWGEDSYKIFDEFITRNFNSKLPNNFILIKNEYSNYEIFKNINRLVTFWGTCHIEAAAFGIKPIIIRDVQLSLYNPKLVFKPKNLQEYKSKLLTKNMNQFKLNKNQIKDSILLIYIREKVLNFIKDVDQHWVLRGDTEKFINKNIPKTIKNIKKYNNFLRKNGNLISGNFTHTLSKDYQKYFLE